MCPLSIPIEKSQAIAQKTAVTLCFGPKFKNHPLWNTFENSVIQCHESPDLDSLTYLNPALIVIDDAILKMSSIERLRDHFPDAILLSEERLKCDTELILTDGLPVGPSRKIFHLACELWLAQKKQQDSAKELHSLNDNLNKLASVGIALNAENDLATLLRKILSEGQNISDCDAASLFLVDSDGKHITFKLTQNDSIYFPFQENKFELNARSIAGFVALNKCALNIENAYQIPESAVYQFNQWFDQTTGYKTVSMLTLPALNKKKEVIAVLQFINRKVNRKIRISPGTDISTAVLPFDDGSQLLLQALAGQAGAAIENAILHKDIQRLFEGFVTASVMAIEQRDPTTSGHSFRVADLCVALARAVNTENVPEYRQQLHSETHIRELRCAALLHDFGKVGVRESVLVKAKKLSEENINSIHFRIQLAKEKLKNKALRQELNLYRQGARDTAKILKIETKLQQELEQLDNFFQVILESNEPRLLNAEKKTDLKRIATYCSPFERNHGFSIISPEEFSMLAIGKGSLSSEERREIESHVTHTRNFLSLIPWTRELSQVPEIAGAHHEKLDGSGYPDGKTAKEIPFASKIMTICDIYDALTASDRPYKAAVPAEFALDILMKEAKAGAVDQSLMNVFIESGAYKTIEGNEYSEKLKDNRQFRHHVCDFDLHDSH